MKSVYLRVKLKSLAAEARIIRTEEQRANKHRDYAEQNRLRLHRVTQVRIAARHTLLAYQFLRGIPYASVERPGSCRINYNSVLKMVRIYGGFDHRNTTSEDIKKWASIHATALAAA